MDKSPSVRATRESESDYRAPRVAAPRDLAAPRGAVVALEIDDVARQKKVIPDFDPGRADRTPKFKP